MKRVVVTGLGLLTSIGNNSEDTWVNLIDLKSGIKKITQKDFGNCRKCKKKIPFGRLIFRPESQLCVYCAK